MGAKERAAAITPNLAVRSNTAGEPVWNATWRDSEGTRMMRTVGKAHLIARSRRPNPRTGADDGEGARKGRVSERWREEWRPAPGRAPAGKLGHREAQVAAQTLVLVREEEVENSEWAQEKRRRNAPIVFGTLMQRYLEEKETDLRDEVLKLSYVRDLRSQLGTGGHMGREFWFKKPEQLDNHAVDKWLDKLRDAGLSVRQRDKLRGTVSAILTFGVDRGWIDSTPLVYRRRRRRKKGVEPLRFYEFDNVELLARTMGERDGELIRLGAYSGLRQGELIALRWSDVDWTAESIRVERSRTAGAMGLPKSGKPRTVPMGQQAAQALERHAKRSGDPRSGVVFPGDRSEFLDPSALRRRWKQAQTAIQEKAEAFPALRLHDLRHSYGTALARAGVPLLSIKEFMGHSDLATTMVYLHYAPKGDEARIVTEALAADAARSLTPLAA